MKVIKYSGAYPSVRVGDELFRSGVPTVVPSSRLAEELLKTPGFSLSSLEELQAHLNPPEPETEPEPAPRPAALTPEKKESK